MSAVFADVWQSWRERLAAPSAGKPPKVAGRGSRAVAEPIPVREWISVEHGQPARLLGFDRTLVCVVVALLALGLVMVYSASVALPDNPKFARYTPTYFLSRHVMFMAIAVVAALVAGGAVVASRLRAARADKNDLTREAEKALAH